MKALLIGACACSLVPLAGCKAEEPALVVFAASSLTDAFTAIEPAVEAELGGDVTFNFAGSQALRVQIEHGAPADVFASANEDHANAIFAAGHTGAPRRFASNGMVAVVGPDSALETFADLAKAERVVVGAREVPIGAYTQTMLDRARAADAEWAEAIEAHVVSREHNVRLVLAKVELGEADAAFVYRTDTPGRRVRVIEIPDALEVRAGYFVSTVRDARPGARRFVDWLLGPAGRKALSTHGFDAP